MYDKKLQYFVCLLFGMQNEFFLLITFKSVKQLPELFEQWDVKISDSEESLAIPKLKELLYELLEHPLHTSNLTSSDLLGYSGTI